MEKEAVKYAYTESLQKTWIVFVCIGMVGFLTSFAIQRRELNKQHEVIETELVAQERYRIEEELRKGENRPVGVPDRHELNEL